MRFSAYVGIFLTLMTTVLFTEVIIIENAPPLEPNMAMLLGIGLVGLFGFGGIRKQK